MSRKLTVIPERCSGCKLCEVVCSINRFGANNPKKSSIRVMVIYPHPVIRMTTPGLEVNRKGNILADPNTGRTSREKVFAGGDIVTGAATVIEAMGAGRRAARAIDKMLKGEPAR